MKNKIFLKDTLSQNQVALSPEKMIKVYSCGPTVYDYPHLGNWYAFLRWDLLVRTLETLGFKVQWVMNITDVGHLVSDADEGEDKLVQKAHQQKSNAYDIARYYTDYFIEKLRVLNFRLPDHLPKATDHIPAQIKLIQSLEKLGLTYVIDDGLYYDTSQLADYGKLTGASRRGLLAGARVDYNPQKKQATDFALWKFSPKGQKRDMEWSSPWGKGFPGWHIECSAMAHAYLGAPIDVHTGGIDHIPIHHTNELAQSEPVYGQPLAKIWLHSNFITINGQKMSKSLNNFLTLEDLVEKGFSPRALRLAVFSTRYFKETDFSWALLKDTQQRLRRWYYLASQRFQLKDKDGGQEAQKLEAANAEVKKHLSQNLNTPAALGCVDSLIKQLTNQFLAKKAGRALDVFCQTLDDLFGLGLMDLDDLNHEQKKLLKARQQAKDEDDFQRSDQIRNQLLEQGIEILDTTEGQIWQKEAKV